MKIQSNNPINYKGYDARPLKGFFMGHEAYGMMDEMRRIGKKEGFKIYTEILKSPKNICAETNSVYDMVGSLSLWAQDIWTFCRKNLLVDKKEDFAGEIGKVFGVSTPYYLNHLAGGNFFIVDKDGEDELVVGASALEKFSIPQLKNIYGVSTVHVIPQMDFHIDLFIRPLDNKKILIADDELTLNTLKKGLKEFLIYMDNKGLEDSPYSRFIIDKFNKVISDFEREINDNKYAKSENIVNMLSNAGFEMIKVPGRIYDAVALGSDEYFLMHECNYINANVLKNSDGDLVYITNKSNIDEILGLDSDFTKDFTFRFEKEFVKYLEPYVKADKIYFVNGERHQMSNHILKEMQGGIHCLCAEIPLNIGK